MNQKGFANIILVLVIVILVGVAGYFAFVKKSEPIVQQPTPTRTPANPTTNWKSDAENTVAVFMKNVNTPGYGDNVNIAFSELTSNAQSTIKAGLQGSSPSPQSLSYSLAGFLHIQEGPDQGTSIVSSEKLNDSTVKVLTKWNYSGMSSPAIKTFTLILEGGQWKIDKVE